MAGPTTPENPPIPVVGIGASAGGLEAFLALLEAMPAQPGIAIVLVQHLDPHHESRLGTILSSRIAMPVFEVQQGMRIAADRVHIIPPNTYMAVADGALVLTPRPDHPRPNLPIDHFLRSLATEMGSRALGVVLSGGGADGTAGLEAIKAVGGITFAQSESSAAHASMPRNAIASGAVDFVLDPPAIARQLIRFGSHPYVAAAPAPEPVKESGAPSRELAEILSFVQQRTGLDFTGYKPSTIGRRLHRRMAFRGVSDLGEYLQVLMRDPGEVDALFQDMLLRVTRFFRDADVFGKLEQAVFRTLIPERSTTEPIRIWVPGCSTGEEVYSLAISLVECLGDLPDNTSVKILATDVNHAVLERARRAVYLESIAEHVSAERLRRFFRKEEGRYRISQRLRDLCVFARHDVCVDPPFAHLDLISCRNTLIYFEPALQQQALSRFHYALKPRRFLVLGPSEDPGEHGRLFATVDRDARIYRRDFAQKRNADVTRPSLDPARRLGWAPTPASTGSGRLAGPLDLEREACTILSAWGPAAILINDDGRIVRFYGDTASYLRPHDGDTIPRLPELAHEDLAEVLEKSIETARTQGAVVRDIPRSGGASRSVRLHVLPLKPRTGDQQSSLVVFEQPALAQSSAPAGEAEVARLQLELNAARVRLQATVEAFEATNEELVSANEEVHASNEELQSTNEEMQTTKEELQSLNEELETVNEEQHARNRDLDDTNDDLTNLMAGTRIPVIMINRDLRIRRLTSEAQALFGLTPADVGRPLATIPKVFDRTDLDVLAAGVIDTLAPAEVETRTQDGRWYSIRIRVYETDLNRIDGAVITIIDIDVAKRLELELRSSRDFVSNLLDAVRECLVAMDHEFRVRLANRAFYRAFGLMPDEVVGRSLREVGGGLLDIPGLQAALEQVRDGGAPPPPIEREHVIPARDRRVLRLTPQRVISGTGEGSLMLLGIEDITDFRAAEEERHRALMKLQQSERVESLGLLAGGIAHDLNNLLTPIVGYASLAQEFLPSDSEGRSMLDDVVASSEEAAALVQQILTYAGKGRFVLQPQNISTLIEGMGGILRPLISKSAELRFELAPELPVVRADASQVRQVVSNLVTNASESLVGGTGEITVRTGVTDVPPGTPRYPGSPELLAPGRYAFVEVVDTGCGMEPETVAKIFEPFFTTKFTGRGLGLATLVGIVQGHRGGVIIQSARGRGTCFRVLLPTADKVDLPASTASLATARWRGTGTVLLADDDEKVRSLAAHYLQRSGFEVLLASDGHEATREFHEHRGKLVAVLMDVAMPHMGGLEATKKLRAIDPGVPVILMSGHSAADVIAHAQGLDVTEFIHKPFTEDVLVQALKRSLTAR